MWNPLKRAPEASPTPPPPSLEALIGEVSELRARFDALTFEWAEVLDRIQRWSAREAARKRRDVVASLSDDQPPGEGEGQPGAGRPAESKMELRRRVFGGKGGAA